MAVQIYVDADACPVKDEIARVAERYDLVVTMVANGGLRPSRDPMLRTVIVAQGADIADDWIAENTNSGDIVITADIPLAQRCLEKGSLVLGPTGKDFDAANIGMAIAMRGLKQELRETGVDKGFNAAFGARDRSNFLQRLDQIVQRSINQQKSPE